MSVASFNPDHHPSKPLGQQNRLLRSAATFVRCRRFGGCLEKQFGRRPLIFYSNGYEHWLWDDTFYPPRPVTAEAVNRWLFNADTVDKVLEHLMTQGHKVAGGDRLGKTILFAKNHDHAEFIARRFDANYPHYAGHFARVSGKLRDGAMLVYTTGSFRGQKSL